MHVQSSALGFLLAQKHFTNPLVAVPSAVSVVCMAVRLLLEHLGVLDSQLYFSLQFICWERTPLTSMQIAWN
jgi:hypothetical protein